MSKREKDQVGRQVAPCARSETAILDATRELIAERGVGGLTVEGVAARSGVATRGDLRPDTDVRVAHELLVGPLFYRLLLSGAPLNTQHANQIVEAVLRAFVVRNQGQEDGAGKTNSCSIS